MNVRRALLGFVALLGLAGTAQAAYISNTWVDSVAGGEIVNGHNPLVYSHDLENFSPGHDFITDFLLTINLYDDADDKKYEFEAAFVDIPGILGDGLVFNFGNAAYQGWSIAGLVELNLFGSLTVSITSLYGDFVFGGSQLVANGYTTARSTTGVPEPATLGLLGMGLLGVAAAARRRKTRN